MTSSGFPVNLSLPDLWQQEAVRYLKGGRDVIVDAPTGAGKTRVFELLVTSGLRGQAIFTVPTRALANDKRLEWQREGWDVGIVTGDISESAGAPVVVATLETQRERLLRGEGPALLVIDEYQMLGDPVRGLAYELAMVLAPIDTRLLLLSGSVGNTREVAEWLRHLGRRVEVVSTPTRPVPLEEIPREQLPRHAPKKITGFWPRLAAEVLMSGFGPLLIFAPQRKEAEKIARQIASAVPTPDPLALTREQEQILGPQFASLLQQRVAVHHSGMSYQQRAGVVEPLAKAGQLRVVVATTGLAAGINFSMRSVTVTDSRIFDGQRERELTPDELLQMFGRAGRRGLDDAGYVIATAQSPRLSEANQRYLRRSNQLDWPTLLRIMYRASLCGESPFAAAAKLCEALFSKQKLLLGFETATAPNLAPDAPAAETARADQNTLFGLRPTRVEILNSRGEWEVRNRERFTTMPLGGAWIHYKNHLEPALEAFHFVSTAFPIGRVCRIKKEERTIYGKELAMGIERSPRRFTLTRNIRHLTSLGGQQEYSLDQLDDAVIPLLIPHLLGGKVAGMVQRQEILIMMIDFSETSWPVYEDRHGVALVEPDERIVAIEHSPRITADDGAARMAAGNSAVYAWRTLGLIEEDGTPTRRGVVFSCFKGGEGLAIAAALEDESYPLNELVLHLANLRGGNQFHDLGSCGSERLASACLHTYGAVNYEGYLDAGVPAGYGEGTAEVIEGWIGPSRKKHEPAAHIGEGDIQRALTEWLSLLRQIVNAPEIHWDRWERLRNVCRAELTDREKLVPLRDLPHVPAIQLGHQTSHHLVAI
jgi:DEAD/DEAH box helicase/Helicase conserved C-terminal domain